MNHPDSTPIATTSLRVPRDWLERRLKETAPDLSQPALAQLKDRRDELRSHESRPLCAFDISYNPNSNSLDRWAETIGMPKTEMLGAIAMDMLHQGVSVQATDWKDGDGGNKVIVFSGRWQLVFRTIRGQYSRQPLAVLDSVKALDVPTKKFQVQPASVRFFPIWDEVSSSPQRWLSSYRIAKDEYFENRRQADNLTKRISQFHEQRKRVISDAGRELRRGLSDEAVRTRDKIHRDIRRQYSALRVMMDLLKLRSERESHVFEATVLEQESLPDEPSTTSEGTNDTSADVLRLQLHSGAANDILDEDCLVELSTEASGISRRARIRSMAPVDDCLHVECDLAADAFPAGAHRRPRIARCPNPRSS